MGRYFIIMSKIPSDDILESLCKMRLRESDQLKTVSGIVRHGDSSEEIEDNGEEEHRSVTSIAKFGRQTREKWNRSSDQKSKGNVWRWKTNRKMLPVEGKRPGVEGRPVQFPAWEWRSCAKTRSQSRHTFRGLDVTRSKCVEEKKYPRQK